MNVYELTTQTLQQCRFDVTDAQDRTDNQAWIVAEMNTAYKRICREKVHPWTFEEVTMDANKCFSTGSLDNKLVRINKISRYRDYSADGGGVAQNALAWDLYDGSGTVVVPGAEAGGTVGVEYEFMPDDLEVMAAAAGESFVESAANTPQIDAQWHPILTYWASAQYFMTKGPNYATMAAMWTNLFDREFAYITDSIGEQQEIVGATTPWI